MTEPAAGWYHDPSDAGAWRWWDGASWTDHVRASDGVATAPALHAVPPMSGPVQVIQPEPVVSAPSPMLPPSADTAPETFGTPIPAAPPGPEPTPAPAPVVAAPVTAPAEPVVAPSSHYQPVPTHPPVFDTAPAAEAAPVSAPTPVQPPSTPAGAIPQPGQVAAAPVGGGPVSATPETPVSDQMYWHSSAAEVIEVPRHHNSSASRAFAAQTRTAPRFVRDWNDLGSPNTPGIWLLALTPLIGPGVYIAIQIAMRSGGLTGIVPTIVSTVAVVLLAWIFAALDARALGERGYHAPSVAWMLLFPPLAYFIARGKAVRRETKSAWGPELVYILGILGTVGALVVMWAVLSALVLPYLRVS
jgi:hypothetical protein